MGVSSTEGSKKKKIREKLPAVLLFGAVFATIFLVGLALYSASGGTDTGMETENFIPTFLLYTLLAVLPSFVWLFFFLKTDKNPEPRTRILVIFLLGIVSAIPILFFESSLLFLINNYLGSDQSGPLAASITSFLKIFVAVAFVEEIFKYLVVRLAVLNHQEFDEPIDAPIYMITSALGFAAAENVLVLNSTVWASPEWPFYTILIRFLGATFLHALSSAAFGCFIALSFYNLKRRNLYFLSGLGLAVLLHGLFNFFIMKSQDFSQFEFLILILIGVALVLFSFSKKIKRLKNICKLN
jgi:RsiW-degrading membrane proteinase PrsW (M82 family)